jgi:hypothetical protein
MTSDPFSQELAKQAVSAIPRALEGLLDIGARFCGRRDLLNHAKAYRSALESDCSQMQILGMERPVPLESVYTEVRLLTRVKERMFRSIEELEQETREEVQRRSLESIRGAVLKRLEEEARSQRAAAMREAADDSYGNQLVALKERLSQRLRESSDPVVASLPLDRALVEIKAQYEAGRASIRRYEDELAAHAEKYRRAREEVNRKYKTLKGDYGEQLSRDKAVLKQQFHQAEVALREARDRCQESLSRYKGLVQDVVQAYELEAAALNRERKALIAKAQRQAEQELLSEEAQREVFDKMEREVERELEERTQRELTEKVLDDFGHGWSGDSQVLSAWDAIQSKDRSLVLGKPGAGKTTFLKHVVLRNLGATDPTARLPIFVALREFAASSCTELLDFIVDEFSTCGFPNAAEFVDRVLKAKNRCVVLFDGLDEVPQERQAAVVRQIVKMTRRFRDNQYVVSCRTANYQGQLEGFTEFEVAEFGPQQVAAFVQGWFADDNRLATSFLVDLKRYPGLQELATTPLLLALLCIGYRRNQCFPDQKALVYLASLDALVTDWDSSKQLRRDVYVKSFDPESKKQLLCKVACDTFCEKRVFFTEQDVVARLQTNAELLPIRGRGAEILKEYVENHGLLVERAKGIFSFSHLTIQEFLAALHLSRFQDAGVLERLADEAWKDRGWKEVVVFLGGLLPQGDTFVVCLRNRLKEGLKERSFQELLMGQRMPRAAEAFMVGHAQAPSAEAWEAWFRWRIFEYRLHEASYGRDCAALMSQVGMVGISGFIGRALDLGSGLSHDLRLDRPLNQALRESLGELPRQRRAWSIKDEIEDVGKYVSVAAMIAEALGAGARVTPALRTHVLVDIGTLNFEKWDYPGTAHPNLLGV